MYTDSGTDELRAFGYITADEPSLLTEVLLTGTSVENVFPAADHTDTDRGVFHMDRSGTVLRVASRDGGTRMAAVGFLDADTVEATVTETGVTGKFTVSVGTKRKKSVNNILLSRDFPEDTAGLLDQRETLGKSPCEVSVYGMCHEISVVDSPDPSHDHFMTRVSEIDWPSSTFNIGGTVTSVRQERNSLTGGCWYRIGLNATIPVTLAAGDETRTVPKIGDVVHVETELYFSRTLPLIDQEILPSSAKFDEVSESTPSEHSGDFIPLAQQEIEDIQNFEDDQGNTDEIRPDDSTFVFLSKCYDVPEQLIEGIDSVLNLTGISESFLEDVTQEISLMSASRDGRPPVRDLAVNALHSLGYEDESLNLARKIFELCPSYSSFSLLMDSCRGRSDRFLRQEITWVEYLITHRECPEAGLIRNSGAFRLLD